MSKLTLSSIVLLTFALCLGAVVRPIPPLYLFRRTRRDFRDFPDADQCLG
jgi:hypothetical protein